MRAHRKRKTNEPRKNKEEKKYGCPSETVRLRVRPTGKMPVKKEEEAWLLGKSLPLS